MCVMFVFFVVSRQQIAVTEASICGLEDAFHGTAF